MVEICAYKLYKYECFQNPIKPVGPIGNTCAGSNSVAGRLARFDENQWTGWLAYAGPSVGCVSGLRSSRHITAQLLRPATPPLLGTDLLGPGGIRLGAFEVRLIRLLGLFEALVQSCVQRFEHKVPLLFIMLLYCLQVYRSKGRLIFYFSLWRSWVIVWIVSNWV